MYHQSDCEGITGMNKITNRYLISIASDVIALVISFAAAAVLSEGGAPAFHDIYKAWIFVIFSTAFTLIFNLFEMYKSILIDYKYIVVTVILTAVYSGIKAGSRRLFCILRGNTPCLSLSIR
jgi:hypothetical protein